ncbi:hypothetical protein Tsubulata_011569, partial [Turnera subulata]
SSLLHKDALPPSSISLYLLLLPYFAAAVRASRHRLICCDGGADAGHGVGEGAVRVVGGEIALAGLVDGEVDGVGGAGTEGHGGDAAVEGRGEWLCPPRAQKDKSMLVMEDDLKYLWKLVEEKDGGPAWIQMMDRSTPTMGYQVWRRDLQITAKLAKI